MANVAIPTTIDDGRHIYVVNVANNEYFVFLANNKKIIA